MPRAWLRSLLTLALLAGECSSAARRIPLREVAEAGGSSIFLSDLLPDGAPAELDQRAKTVDLGRAPAPGSLRTLGRDWVLARLSRQHVSPAALDIPAEILIRRAGPALDRDSVRAAVAGFLRDRGWRAEELPTADMLAWSGRWADQPAAPMRVASAAWDRAGESLQFQVRSAERGPGSFLVAAFPGTDLAGIWRERWNAQALTAKYPGGRAVPRLGPVLARPGESAILRFEGDGIRISLPVICLERGASRQRIRVREAKGRRVWRAEVISPGQLRLAF